MLADIRAAFSFLTILPVGVLTPGKRGKSFAYFPLVGVGIGALLTTAAQLSPFDRDLTAFFVLLTWVLLTGGLHLDGFGDSCDGLLATIAPSERLRIMKDPRTGVWAVAGLILLLLGKWLALRTVPVEWLILPPVLGRWAMVLAAQHFPYIDADGLAAYWRDGLGRRQLLIASATVALLMTQIESAALWLLIYALTMLGGHWTAKRLGGGITGDVYGALCELTELTCLLALGLLHA